MILPLLCRQTLPEAKPLPGTIDRDAGPAAEKPGKDRDTSGEFEALVAALAAAGMAPDSAPTAPAPAEAGCDVTAVPAGTGKAAAAAPAAPAPPEVQIAAGGTIDLAIVPDLAARPLAREAPAEPVAMDSAARQGTDSQTVARGSALATNSTEGPAGVPPQGGDGTDPLPTGPSDNASAAAPVRIMVHASTTPAALVAPDATGPAPDAPDTNKPAPAVEGAGENRTEADGGDDPPDAGTGTADSPGRQKPAGSENGAPLSLAPQHPARPEPDMRAIAAPPADPADPSSRQDPAAEAIAKATHHMAEAAHHKRNGTVEIALSPEELGHLRLTIRSHESGAASVHLSADRQDTLDLMRRHVELLAQDMRDLGYKDLSFSFQDKTQRGMPDFGRGDQPGPRSDTPPTAQGLGAAPAGLRAMIADSGLDIRI